MQLYHNIMPKKHQTNTMSHCQSLFLTQLQLLKGKQRKQCSKIKANHDLIKVQNKALMTGGAAYFQ